MSQNKANIKSNLMTTDLMSGTWNRNIQQHAGILPPSKIKTVKIIQIHILGKLAFFLN